jgi:hypothetical protein
MMNPGIEISSIEMKIEIRSRELAIVSPPRSAHNRRK